MTAIHGLPFNRKLPEDQARAMQLFLDDPALPIGEAARILNKERHGVSTDTLTRLRQEVRQMIGQGHSQSIARSVPHQMAPVRTERKWNPEQKAVPAPVAPFLRRKSSEPFNPPKLAAQRQEVPTPMALAPRNPPMTAAQVLAKAAESVKHTKPSDIQGTVQVPGHNREALVAYANDWALSHPTSTVAEARRAIQEKFGVGLGTTQVSQIMKDARELLNIPQPRQVVDRTKMTPALRPVAEASRPQVPAVKAAATMSGVVLKDLALRMREIGLKRMEMVDGNLVIEMEGILGE